MKTASQLPYILLKIRYPEKRPFLVKTASLQPYILLKIRYPKKRPFW